MDLQKETYTGDIHQKIIVSAENGRRHVATNPSGQYAVRHYRLDGALIKNEQCCDFLLINDTGMKAYYIELKGSDFSHAVEQVEAGEKLCRSHLKGYVPYYRIVTSKTRTQELNSTKFRRFQQRVGADKIKYGTNEIKETL